MSPRLRAWLQIHFCVVLWGFTAILGKLISLAALPIVWWRMLIVAGTLLLTRRAWSGLRVLPPRLIAIYAGIGVLVAVHWLTFYASVKLSNASIAATCMALTPVFISFVEPFLVGTGFNPRELLFGLAVIPGVILVIGGTPSGMRLGVAIGAVSSLFVAAFASLNKRYIGNTSALTVTGIEMTAGVSFLTLLGPFLPDSQPLFVLPSMNDAWLLLVLALGCTLLPFALSLGALRHLSAFSTVLAVNLEPIYAIVFAILILGEQRELTPGFYWGVAIILAVVFLHPWLSPRRQSSPEASGESG